MNEEELYKTKSGFMNEWVAKDKFLVHFDEQTVSTEVLDFFEKTLDLPKGSKYNKQH
jgi:hypothetical protein